MNTTTTSAKSWENLTWEEKIERNDKVIQDVKAKASQFVEENILQYYPPACENYYDRTFVCKHCGKQYRSKSNPYTQRACVVMGKQVSNLVRHIEKVHGIRHSYSFLAYRTLEEAKNIPDMRSTSNAPRLDTIVAELKHEAKMAELNAKYPNKWGF